MLYLSGTRSPLPKERWITVKQLKENNTELVKQLLTDKKHGELAVKYLQDIYRVREIEEEYEEGGRG